MSVFAQELGTAEPVSAVKLDRALAAGAAREDEERAPRETPRSRPLLPPPSPSPTAGESSAAVPKRAPLKDLNALGNLFRR